MALFLKRFKARFNEIIGMDRMGSSFYIVSFIHLFFLVYTTLETVFINTLLFSIFNSMSKVIIYRGIVFVVTAIAMQIAAYMSQIKSSKTVIRISTIFYIIMYAILFLGLDYIQNFWQLIAVLSGIGTALYWSAHNVLLMNYTTDKNRTVAVSITGLIQGVVTLVLPLIAGTVIGNLSGNKGYRVMFGIGMVFAIIQIFYTNKLENRHSLESKSQIKLAFKLIKEDVYFRYMMLAECIRGMRDGVFTFLMNMLLFEIITNETLTGINTFIAGVAAILGSWAYGKLVVSNNTKRKYFAMSTSIIITFALLLFVKMSPATLMIFTALNGFFQLFLTNTNSNTSYSQMYKSETSRKAASELFALREISLAIGRSIGLFLLMKMPQQQTGYVFSILILTVVQYLGLYFIKKIDQGV